MQAAPDHRLIRPLRAIAQSTAWRVAIFVALAAIATKPLLSHAGDMNLFRDAQVLEHYEDAARTSVVKYGQAPLWDPWYCGGMYGLGSPQSRFASPTFVLTLLFGTSRAGAIIVFVMIALGLEGAFRYARAHRATSFGAMLAAPAFALSGAFATAPAMGWINFMGFELLPWALFGLRRATQGRTWGIALSAIALAWMVGMGGTYTAPISALFCGFEAAWAIGIEIRKKNRARALTKTCMAAACGVLALVLSAGRLWPVLETLRMAPRVIGGAPANTGAQLIEKLVMPLAAGTGAGDFGAGAFYVGAPLVVPLLAALYGRRRWSMMVCAFLAFWLAAGYAALPSLFDMLRALPLYSTLRYPERFLIPFALCAAVLVANGLSIFETLKTRWVGLVVVLLVAINVGIAVRNHHFAAGARALGPPAAVVDQPFHQARGNRWAAAMYTPMNRGSLSCWDAYPVPQSAALVAALPDEVYLADPSAGEAKTASWSPQRIEVEANLVRPARVRINQNWHPGWTASIGRVAEDDGLVAVDLPEGKHTTELRFRPRSGLGGAMVSGAALIACLALILSRRLSPHGCLLLSATPLLPFVAILTLWKEPPIVDRRLVTPRGDPVVADAPPPDATVVNAKLEGDITLVAVRALPRDPLPGTKVLLELDWKTGDRVPDGVGIFVHIEPSTVAGQKIDRMNADHATISGVVELERAPKGKILRDQIELGISDELKGRTLTIYAGVWMMRGRERRLAVRDPGPLAVSDDRLLITTLDVR
jgi:hypothetical protein